MKVNKILPPVFLIFSCALSVAAQSKALVTETTASLREKPGTDGKIKLTIKKDAELKILKKQKRKGWRYVSVKKQEGWVRADRIRVLVDDPQRSAVWLFIGRSVETNGFRVAYYLNITQMVRNEETVNFWTKMVPTNNEAYLETLMSRKPKKKPVNFNYNLDQWEGDCETKKIRLVKSLLYWKNGQVDNFKPAGSKPDMSDNTAARSILEEACKIGKKIS
jgi:hypothetical protein